MMTGVLMLARYIDVAIEATSKNPRGCSLGKAGHMEVQSFKKGVASGTIVRYESTPIKGYLPCSEYWTNFYAME